MLRIRIRPAAPPPPAPPQVPLSCSPGDPAGAAPVPPVPPLVAPVPPAAADWLRDSGAQVGALERDWAEQLAHYKVNPGEEELLAAAIELRHRLLAADLTARNPAWLTHWLGSRPQDPGGANVYDETVATIAVCRDRLSGYELGEPDARAVAERIDALTGRIDAEPKSRAWKLRARVGERKRWYETPEELGEG